MRGLASSLDASLTLAPGSTLGRYRVLRRLAVGGMAELHLAKILDSTEPNPYVVIKRVLPHLALDPEFVKLFRNEAQISALLHHPNIVEVTEVAEIEDEFCYVMRYVHGQNLRAVLNASSKRGSLPLEVALTIIAASARGLHHAHEQRGIDGKPLGLVHRDVSPSNILVGYDGSVRVADFGIAKAAARTERTRGSVMKGKVGYMSPEQCLGTRVDRRSDVYALGILLYETTTQSRLFWADGDFAILSQIVRGEFEPPSARVPGYPPQLEAIVLRALAANPDDRFPTAAALGREVEALFGSEQRPRTCVQEHMHTLFGEPEPPWAEFAENELDRRGAGASRSRAVVDFGRRRQPIFRWAALALALGGGVGLGAALRGEPAPANANTASVGNVPPASPGETTPTNFAPPASAVVASDALPSVDAEDPSAANADAEPVEDAEPAVDADPAAAVASAPPAERRSGRKRRPARRKPAAKASGGASAKSLFPDGF